tara:strand:+ start:10062 stop:10304 length:243 start_codon:yes stop_codon:yes gene_type:complete
VVANMKLEGNVEKLAHLKSLETIPSINPRIYDPSESYSKLDFINHKTYGTGFVVEVLDGNKIRVFFESGEKIVDQKTYTI